MRKLTRFLACFLAALLVLSNLQFATINVKAAEGDEIIQDDGEEGEVEDGDIEEGDTEEGDTEEGDTEEGDTEEGDTEEGDTEEGDTEEGDTEEGDTEEGDTEEGDTEEGDTEEGDTEEGDTEEGDTEEGDTEEGDDDEAPVGEVTYNFNDLGDSVGGYGFTVEVDETTGVADFAFDNGDSGYGEAIFNLPEDFDSSKVTKAELLLEDGTSIFLKLYLLKNGGGYIMNEWGNPDDCMVNYSTTIEPTWQFESIGIVSEPAKNNAVISGIRFTFGDVDLPEKEAPAQSGEAEVKVFTADDITFAWADPEGEDVCVKQDGKWVVKFTGKQYAQVALNLPEAMDLQAISQVKFTVADQTVPVAFKLLSGGSEIASETVYGKSGSTEYVIIPKREDVATVDGIGLMITSEPVEGDTISLVSVEFTVEDVQSDITYGDNIILNPNFAEEDLTVWNAENTTTATIGKGEAEEAIFGDVTTYGIIDRDPETSLTGDAFTQDITNVVEIGKEYKVEFWAKLSDDYAEAPANQRVVEFAPYFVTEQDGNVYLGASYSTQLSGKLSQTLTVGEWTQYSGTFRVTHSGAINKVVIRILEQGTDYGAGDCVKGDYYVTGVSMTEIIKPEITVKEEELNWKDAITDAFGDDAIAGTCLGSGTITYGYLQEITKQHFNAITFENEMKPDITLGSSPKFDEETGELVYNFNVADGMLATIKSWNDNNEADIKIRGHVLVWHSQTPEWFFHEDYDTSKPFLSGDEGKAEMDRRMEHYIKSVFEHYQNVVYEDGTTAADLFYGWDVVNEAMSDNTGKPRMIDEGGTISNWARVYGEQSNEYIIKAFRFANKYADDHIQLFYNDYNDCSEPKATGIAELLAEITSHENDAVNPTRIDGMGMQAHHNFGDPTPNQIKAAINKYLDALGEGGTVQMTEFDVKASSTYDPNNVEAEHDKQAWRFKEIFDAYREVYAERGGVSGITMWGVTDNHSWLQSSNSVGGASQGGTHAPLLFAVDQKNYLAYAKPAFYAFFDERVDDLKPYINNVTVIQQLEENNFDKGISYDVAGKASFIPMWTNEGLVVKVSVTDAEANGTADYVAIYVDEAGEIAKTIVTRPADDTDADYEAIVTIPMKAASAKTFLMDVVVFDNNEAVAVYNDKKNTYETSSQYYAEAIMKPYAILQRGSIEVDGEYDATWDSVDEIPLTIKLGAEADATVKALWDSEFLYIYADVKDANLDMSNAEVHQKDSIEVFIDENNAKTESYEADDKQYRINYANEQTFNGTKCVAENISSATKLTADGYIVEAAFAWTDIVPKAGMEIGLEFQINDAKNGSRIGTASWYDASGNGWQSTAVYGNVLLEESGFSIAEIDDQVYTGKAIIPEVGVYNHANKLVYNKDYTVKCTNNVNVGVATATITGKGNYAGTTEVLTFNIVKKDLADVDITVADIQAIAKKDGTVTNPKVAVKFGKTTLKADKDYTIVWPEIMTDENGKAITNTYEVEIKAVEDTETSICNFTGSKTINYKVIANTDVSISKVTAKISGKVSYADYMDNGVRPALTVTYKGEDLLENSFIDVEWPDEVTVGKNNVVTLVADSGFGFYGTKTLKFEVTGTKLTASAYEIKGIEDAVYTGAAIEFDELSVWAKDAEEDAEPLVAGDDYEVSYAKNVNVGTATVTVKGIGGYTGSIKKSFKIAALDIATEGTVVSVNVANQTYTGKKLTPAPVVRVNGITLTSKDYTAKYSNNTNVGTATVKITLKGNYKGALEDATFTIGQKALTAADITVNGPFNATLKKNGTLSNPKVTVKMGKTTLKANRDYAIVWPEYETDEDGKIVAGAYEVIVNAVEGSNFKGSVKYAYDVLAYGTVQMSKVTVKVTKASYLDYLADETSAKVTVKQGKVDLIADDKVTIEYPDTVAVGKNNLLTVYAKDGSGYYGSKTVKFELTGIKLVDKAAKFEITGIEKQYTYTGENIKPVVEIKDVERDYVLVEGEDYTVEYTNCKNAGKKASVVIKGQGAYTGKITKKFEIVKYDMTTLDKVLNAIFGF